MTRLWTHGLPIHVQLASTGLPSNFLWNGRRHPLARIVQHWQVDTDWWSAEGPVHRDYYAVLTLDGLFCVLYYDHLAADWRLHKLYD